MVFIFILLLAQWMPSIIHPPAAETWNTMPMYHFVFDNLIEHPRLATVIAMLIFSASAILLVRLNAKYFLIDDRSFMPATIFILMAGSFTELHQLNPVLIGTLFLLITIMILFNGQEDKPDSYRIFNASLVLGAGSLFYLNLIWFIPLIWLTILVLRPLRWRELVYPIVVYMIISLFLITYYWVALDDLNLLVDILRNNLASPDDYSIYDSNWIILIAYLLFLVIVASIYLLRKFQAKKNVIRKLYQVFFIVFLYSILFDLIVTKMMLEVFYILAIPASYLLSNFFHQRRNHWSHEVLLWIWIGIIVVLRVFVN